MTKNKMSRFANKGLGLNSLVKVLFFANVKLQTSFDKALKKTVVFSDGRRFDFRLKVQNPSDAIRGCSRFRYALEL